MDARLSRAARIAALVVLSCAANLNAAGNYRTQNFLISAPSPQLAREIGDAAERFRHELAVEWLGHPLPNWSHPCPISAQVAPGLGAGGVTSFSFHGRQPSQWTMSVQGTRERVLDSVLPHEITHTIFATHFGRPVPRWADEGGCTTVEHQAERSKQEKLLAQFLTTDRGIPFNRMFEMREYPADILPLYSQGYSLARFLIAQGGKQKFVQYVGEGMDTNNWPQATRQHYGFRDLSELQLTWVEWIRHGGRESEALAFSPLSSERHASVRHLASTIPASALPSRPAPLPSNSMASTRTALPVVPATYPASAAPVENATTSDGWYLRMRDRARLVAHPETPGEPVTPVSANSEKLLEWRRSNATATNHSPTVRR